MIVDNVERSRFELAMPGGVAFATYRRSPGVVTVIHTEVPQALSGQGVASELSRGLLEMIRSRGEKVIPRCKFLAGFMAKHPEYNDLIAAPK
ncbi:MAG TPA: GNAT family N-acetyltransferase [Polyangiaceae bacterium]|nr:GNAT family N-acetyltransferase [Polyangiaceae bacterium]